jgi:hypothetical protein
VSGTDGRGQSTEFGSRTRRRPIKRDYAAARCGSGKSEFGSRTRRRPKRTGLCRGKHVEVGNRNWEVGMRKWKIGIGKSECGIGKSELGSRNAEVGNRNLEVGPVVVPNERDYAAASMWKWEIGIGKSECGSGKRERVEDRRRMTERSKLLQA